MVGHKATVKLPNPLLLPIEVSSPYLLYAHCLFVDLVLVACITSIQAGSGVGGTNLNHNAVNIETVPSGGNLL